MGKMEVMLFLNHLGPLIRLHLCSRHLLSVFKVSGTVLGAPVTQMTDTESQVPCAPGLGPWRVGSWKSGGERGVQQQGLEHGGLLGPRGHTVGSRGRASWDHIVYHEAKVVSTAFDASEKSSGRKGKAGSSQFPGTSLHRWGNWDCKLGHLVPVITECWNLWRTGRACMHVWCSCAHVHTCAPDNVDWIAGKWVNNHFYDYLFRTNRKNAQSQAVGSLELGHPRSGLF